jgi:hypothetical protein
MLICRSAVAVAASCENCLVGLEVLAIVIQTRTVEQGADHFERLFHAFDLLGNRRPLGAERSLVERFAGTDAEERPAGEQRLERRPRLRDQDRVISTARRVTALPIGTRSVECPAAPSHTQACPDSPGSHQGWR